MTANYMRTRQKFFDRKQGLRLLPREDGSALQEVLQNTVSRKLLRMLLSTTTTMNTGFYGSIQSTATSRDTLKDTSDLSFSYFKRNVWRYNRNSNEFNLNNCSIDFRSADKPENMEGFGYHLVIINEAGIVLKKKNLWQESILPMIMDHEADVIIGGTPKGKKVKSNEKHLFYELFQRGIEESQKSKVKGQNAEPGRIKYESFNFSTYDNPFINPEEIKELEKEIPPHLRDQEIHGLFIDSATSRILKREWFGFFQLHELAEKKRVRKIQIWDTAFKESQENDFSVCETWIEMIDGYYLINLFRDRLEFPDLKKKAIELYTTEKPDQVWIEDKASGISLIQELKRNTSIPLKEIKAVKDKIEYVNASAPVIEGKEYGCRLKRRGCRLSWMSVKIFRTVSSMTRWMRCASLLTK